MKMYKLDIFGSYILFNSMKELISSLECDLDDLGEPVEIIISPVEISEDEYSKLPEFTGY